MKKEVKKVLLPFFLIALLRSLLRKAKFNLRLSFFNNLAALKKLQFLSVQVRFQLKIKIF